MGWALLFILAAVAVLFSLPLLLGSSLKPGPRARTSAALDLLDLKPGQKLLIVGSGSGRSLKLAARRSVEVTGYEINPVLAIFSMYRCLPVRRLVTVRWADLRRAPLDRAQDGTFIFLLKPYMRAVQQQLEKLNKPIKIVTYKDAFPDHKPRKTRGGLAVYNFKPGQV